VVKQPRMLAVRAPLDAPLQRGRTGQQDVLPPKLAESRDVRTGQLRSPPPARAASGAHWALTAFLGAPRVPENPLWGVN